MTARFLKPLLAGCTAFLLTGCWSLMQPASGYEPGEKVAAKWSTSWYEATVIGRDGDNWVVRYSDNTLGTVRAEDMRHLLRKDQVQVGMRVLAMWRSTSWYPGTIVAVEDQGATVKWDDGSSPSFAPFGKIISATP